MRDELVSFHRAAMALRNDPAVLSCFKSGRDEPGLPWITETSRAMHCYLRDTDELPERAVLVSPAVTGGGRHDLGRNVRSRWGTCAGETRSEGAPYGQGFFPPRDRGVVFGSKVQNSKKKTTPSHSSMNYFFFFIFLKF